MLTTITNTIITKFGFKKQIWSVPSFSYKITHTNLIKIIILFYLSTVIRKMSKKNLLWKKHFEKEECFETTTPLIEANLLLLTRFKISNEKQSFNKINHFIYIHKSKKKKEET